MELYITNVPYWVSISFAILFASIPPLLIANAAKAAYDQGNIPGGQDIKRKIIYFYAAFFFLVGLISLTGFFAENLLPPRIIVTTAIPLFLFYLFIVQRMGWFKISFEHIRLEQLIQIHLFRFVGIYFFLTYMYDAIPYTFAFIGGAGDILTAALAIPLLYFMKRQVSYATTLVWIWNIIGLADILSVLSSAIITTRQAIENSEAGVQGFGTFPFSWIPAFAPATIIFLHILIFKKLLKR
ncbi:MAG: hypothetical protein MI974_25130 [Chitinophagales bacterium]|nr:hypothetical protein [Chitinophagales bacterium]